MRAEFARQLLWNFCGIYMSGVSKDWKELVQHD